MEGSRRGRVRMENKGGKEEGGQKGGALEEMEKSLRFCVKLHSHSERPPLELIARGLQGARERVASCCAALSLRCSV
ncbi:hypothetical protein E2C01_093762 [Portunus trituberculatus]|uniref:Uncharacterized protein n=1 Tax=Portunus trituberculatus TaxID=210409 RepID=A0A5B7JVB9_PORTR|nr:hypothetical protein [Portunus trituberculatus]